MDRFVSNVTLRLDSKGRVSIPAAFRSVLGRDGFDGLYCYPALDRPAIDAGGNALMAEIEALIARYAPFSEEREQFALALYGTSETLKIDGEGRVMLSETVQAACGHYRRGRLRRSRPQVSDLGARPLSHELAEATQKVRALRRAEFPGRRAGARSTGMTAGGDGFALSLADQPPTFPCSAAPRSTSSMFVTAASISTPPSAPAATRARSSPRPTARSSASTATEARSRSAANLPKRARPPDAGRGPLLQSRAVAHAHGLDAVDGVVLDLGVSSMQLDTAERGFSFRHDGPLDMRMGGDGAERRRRRRQRERARPRQYHFPPRRGAPFARRRPRHRQGARRDADPHHRARSPTSSPRWCARGRATSIRRRARSRRCAFSSTTNSASWSARLAAAERILKPDGRLVVVSFHSLEDRIVKTFLADRSDTRAGSRHAPERKRAGADLPRAHQAPVIADEAEIARNPRARSAKLRAAERSASAGAAGRCRRSAAAPAVARRCAEGPLDHAPAQHLRHRRADPGGLLRLQDQIRFHAAGRARRQALRGELRRERDAIAALRAEWAKLDTPGRIQALADRHLALQADQADAIRQPRPSAGRPVRRRWRRSAHRSDRRHGSRRPTRPAACRPPAERR